MQRLVLLVTLIAIFTLVSTLPAFATSTQVNITKSNSTMGCPSATSCFLPYQVTVSVGDTITWTNLDNKTHTVTTGTTNYGAVGNFDSGIIEPGKSYTQFFGIVGKFRYFDSNNPSMTGVILVVKQSDHAELAWVNGSLNVIDHLGNTTTPVAGNSVKISKNIYNSGSVDAPSILFRLKIKNSTNFLVYDNIVYANIGAKQTVPVSFSWLPEKPGNYQLFFDADPANTIGDTNENNDVTYDNLVVFNETKTTEITNTAPPSYYNTTLVPEFGQLAPIILATSISLIVVISSRLKFPNLT